jgi:hypothetical protein
MLVVQSRCGSGFLLDAVDAGLQRCFVVDGFDLLLAHVFDGAGEEAAGAAGGVEHFSPSLGLTMSTMNWVTGAGCSTRRRCRRSAGRAGLLVDVAEQVAVLRLVEVDASR